MTDEQLLGCYLERRDDAAFEVLVRRHGPMVWRVCRRLLARHEDAEDAFQATFLVLVRKASNVSSKNLLGNWLYGVAYRTALKARAVAAQRRTRERQVDVMPEPAARLEEVHDWKPLIDDALSSLPRKYRAAIVLCDLEGLAYKEAATELGWPQGTLSVRLMRAREMLARRLKRQVGSFPTMETLTNVLSEGAAAGAMPAALVAATVTAANVFAAGPTALGPSGAAGVLSGNVATLTQRVLKGMLLAKLKAATAILLLGAVFTGAGLLAYSAVTGKSDEQRIQGTWVVVSAEANGQAVAGNIKELVFAGDKFRVVGVVGVDSAFKLNAAKDPKEIDLGNVAGTVPGIYALDGDNLKINIPAQGGNVRPTQFATKPDDGNYMAVLKRK